ncbi:MAG: nitroreductase [Desulfomonile tiedjei]|nr:nitroreductase [Desulfomonile tiedjei]
MDLLDTLRGRRSVRAFRDEPISRQLLEQVLLDASHAPSAINMQPWEVHMVVGEERKRLSRRLLRAFGERSLTCAPASTRPLADKFMARARECADLMGPLIQQMGYDFKGYVNEGSLGFYGAPAVALLFLDDSFGPERMTDIGLFAGYLILAAAGHGLASCPIGLVKAYEDEIKDHLNIPESKILLLAVALGFPDPTAAVNEFKSPRVGPQEFVRWVD